MISSDSHNLLNWAVKYEMIELLKFFKFIGVNFNVKVNE